MRGRRIVFVALLPLALLALVGCAPEIIQAEGARVVFGRDFYLAQEESLDGDLVVLGGSVTLEEDSQVDGDVALFGGSAEVAGEITGALIVFGGNVDLQETAVVEGDLVTFGGQVDREEGAEVRGEQIVNAWEGGWEWPGVRPFPWVGPVVAPSFAGRMALDIVWGGLRLILTAALMAALAGLVAVLWPVPAARVGRTCIGAPLPAFGVGLLTVVVVVVLLISLCLTVLGVPAALVAGVAAVFGWLALGILAGERMLAALTPRQISPFWSAALGAGLLTLISGLLDLIPCVGWIGGFLVACVGLGAVVLTRFGTQEYPLRQAELPATTEEAAAE